MELVLLLLLCGVAFYVLHSLILHYRLRKYAQQTSSIHPDRFRRLCEALESGERKRIQSEMAALGHAILFNDETVQQSVKALPPPQTDDSLVIYPYAFASHCADNFRSAEDLLGALENAAKQYGTVAFKDDPDDPYELSLEYNVDKKAYNCMYSGGDGETREWLTRDETLALLDRFIVDVEEEEELDNDLVT
ncbi:MAG: hypothetical protein AAF512_17890 [Pseudomonadota bacterium]